MKTKKLLSKDPYFRLLEVAEEQLQNRSKVLYQKLMDDTIKDLTNLFNSKSNYTRTDYYNSAQYIALINNLNKRLMALGVTQNKDFDKVLKQMALQIKKQVNLDIGIPMNASSWNLDPVVKVIWCRDGKDYSQRIWTNTDKVKETLTNGIGEILVRGADEGTLINELIPLVRNTCGSAYNKARTLARTELAYVRAQQTLDAYKEAGIKYYIFQNTVDGETCDECDELVDKVFAVEDAVIGENFPPIHPNCRGWTRAVAPSKEDWAKEQMEVQDNVSTIGEQQD